MRRINPLILLVILLFSSCSLLKKKGNWGENAFLQISRSKVTQAFKKNITSPHVLVPLVGAGASYVGGFDKKVSKWASEKNPVYGDKENALRWSDDLDKVLLYEMYATPLLTASNSNGSFKKYAFNKAKGYAAISLSAKAADLSHTALAYGFKRERPDKSDHLSLPSASASQAGTRNGLTARSLDAIPMQEELRTGIKTLNTALAAGVMWGKVESQRHYPSDVLIGYAIGSFISGFMYDAIMDQEPDRPETFSFIPGPDQMSFQYTYTF